MSGIQCPDCFSGTVCVGTPTGSTTTIHGLPVYVAKPPEGVNPKGIIVIIPDAFGWDFVNNRLLSDNYAERGSFLVYLPDFMNGSSMPFGLVDLMEEKIKKPASWFTTLFYKPYYIAQVIVMAVPWLFKNRASVCKPRIFNFFQALRISPPPFPTNNLKIGAAGFCWGAHPSMVTVPKDIEAVNIPLSVAVGNEDTAMKGPLVLQMKEILEVKKKGDHEVVIMPGAKHGLAIRTDPKDELQNEYAERAEIQAVEWFSRWFV